ncbi:MAG TPA: hypothetical protein VI318_15710 [Baekduia sp.]
MTAQRLRVRYRSLKADPLYQNLLIAFGLLPALFAFCPLPDWANLLIAGAWVLLLGVAGWIERAPR